jgi:hypothetical protein
MRFRIPQILILFAAAVSGCGSEPAPADRKAAAPDGHERMLSQLKTIRQHTPDEHPFLGDLVVRDTEMEIARLPEGAPEKERFLLYCRLGTHQLRVGRTELAIETLRLAVDMLPRVRSEISSVLEESARFGLAVAYLRSGETRNCVHCHNTDSCLFPIRGGGVHGDPEGSNKAIEQLLGLLNRNSRHLPARWLLNIAYMTVGGYPHDVPERFLIPPAAFESEAPFPRFYDVAAETGLNTFSLAGGSIADDFDNDGLLDIVVSDSHTAGQIRFFRNRGDGTFADQTAEAGLEGIWGGLNIVQAYFDNDNDLDILVLRGGWLRERGRYPKSLLRNDGKGRFRDVTFEVGLGEVHYPTQTAAWADYDNDGDLDLFVGNEGYPCQLFENDGKGAFVDVARRAGVENGLFTKGVSWGDYDGDRYPDLYVSNLDGPNRLYHNRKDGTFEDVAAKSGVDRPEHSFPTWFWDFNNDGALDLFVASYTANGETVAAEYLGLPHSDEPDCLFQGDGTGRFRDVTREMNLHRSTQVMGCNFGDLDNDGFLDFYLGTGDTFYEALFPNLMFHNQRGKRFADVTSAGGFGHLQKGHGVSFADLDNDGDQDVFIEVGGAFAGDGFWNALFENPGFGNHWIKLRLVGAQSNRYGVGARIRVEVEEGGARRSIYKWVNSGGSFGSNPLRQEIGLGSAAKISVLEVFWPTTGKMQTYRDVAVDQFLEISEGRDSFRVVPLRPLKFPERKETEPDTRT